MSDIYTQQWNPHVNTNSHIYHAISVSIIWLPDNFAYKNTKSQNTQNKETTVGKVVQNEQCFSKLEPPSKCQENA